MAFCGYKGTEHPPRRSDRITPKMLDHARNVIESYQSRGEIVGGAYYLSTVFSRQLGLGAELNIVVEVTQDNLSCLSGMKTDIEENAIVAEVCNLDEWKMYLGHGERYNRLAEHFSEDKVLVDDSVLELVPPFGENAFNPIACPI